MSPGVASAIRRSPLEGVAPLTGGDLSLRELGPFDKTVARGIGSAAVAGRVVDAGAVTIWHLSPDEAIVLVPPARSAEAGGVLAGARSSVDVSSGHAVLRLAGRHAPALLAAACPVDLAEHAVPDRTIVQAAVAAVRVVLARIEDDGEPGFTILVARDEARYLWDALTELWTLTGEVPT